MPPKRELTFSISPEPGNRAALRPFINMPLTMDWDAFSTTQEDQKDKIAEGRLFFYNNNTKESSWVQPVPLSMPISTRVYKKTELFFGNDLDFKVEIKYPDGDEYIDPTEEYDYQPHDHDDYVPDPEIENFLQTQQHLQTHPYSNQLAFTGDESLNPHPSSQRANQRIRDRPGRDRNFIYFGREHSELTRDDRREDSPPSRLNWRSKRW